MTTKAKRQPADTETIARIRAEWQILESRADRDRVALDQERADFMAKEHANGVVSRDIAAATGKTHAFIIWHLRYRRFLVTTVTKIPERRFRAYWYQVSDKSAGHGAMGYSDEYEARCFEVINQLLAQGKKPEPQKKVKPVTAEALANKPTVTSALTTFHRTARTRYRVKVEPTLKRLAALAGTDRLSYAPDVLAHCAEILMKEIPALFNLLQGDEGE